MAEGFLARWARLKRTPDEPPSPPAAPEPDASTRGESPPEDAPAAWMEALAPAGVVDPGEVPAPPPPVEPVDPERLPPVASLGAESDYEPFLAPSVPDALRLAALRQAWSTDPEIAGFRGFADYDWDFNAPGYGKLLPIDDIAKLRDAIFGDRPAVAGLDEPPSDVPGPPTDEGAEAVEPVPVADATRPDLVAESAGVEAAVPALPEPPPPPADGPPGATTDRRDIVDRD